MQVANLPAMKPNGRGELDGVKWLWFTLDSKFHFQRVVLLEFAYAKHAEANNAAVLVHPLHNSVTLRLAHVSRRIGEGNFEKVPLRVEPQFYFVGHTRSPLFSLSVRGAVTTNALFRCVLFSLASRGLATAG